MSAAYVDSSYLIAILLGERAARNLSQRLDGFDELLSSNLLESEVRSTFAREGVELDPGTLRGLSWILPDRPLEHELDAALAEGYLRGADLWHIACALFAAPQPDELTFLSLDGRQREVAARLGFRT